MEEEHRFYTEARDALHEGNPDYIRGLVMSRSCVKPQTKWVQRQVNTDRGIVWPE